MAREVLVKKSYHFAAAYAATGGSLPTDRPVLRLAAGKSQVGFCPIITEITNLAIPVIIVLSISFVFSNCAYYAKLLSFMREKDKLVY